VAWLDRPTRGPWPHSNVAPMCVVCCIHTAAVRRPNELRLSRFVDAGSPARCSDLTAKPTHGLAQLGGRPQLAHSASASAGRHDGPMAAECHMPICHMLPELRGVANGLMGPPARTGWLGTCAGVAVPPGRPCPRPSGARRGEWRLWCSNPVAPRRRFALHVALTRRRLRSAQVGGQRGRRRQNLRPSLFALCVLFGSARASEAAT